MYFGVDGVSAFQGLRYGVISQIQWQYVPFVTSAHCMAHWTNLTIQTLPHLRSLSRIEALLQCLYVYFNYNPKKHLKFAKLAKIMQIKNNKILWNIKTKWISMINHVKRVLFKYHTLFMKMPLDAPTITSTKSNLCFAD